MVVYFFKCFKYHNVLLLSFLFYCTAIVLNGSAHSDVEIANICQNITLIATTGVMATYRGGRVIEGRADAGRVGEVAVNDLLTLTISLFTTNQNHPSFHVRETVMLCLTSIMIDNWPCLHQREKVLIKDAFSEALLDDKPEVLVLAKAGMSSYLAYKTPAELKILAEAYIKNSNIYANREMKKRKPDRNDRSSSPTVLRKPERLHTITVMMMSCLIQALPYDLPVFMPGLICSFVRHATVR